MVIARAIVVKIVFILIVERFGVVDSCGKKSGRSSIVKERLLKNREFSAYIAFALFNTSVRTLAKVFASIPPTVLPICLLSEDKNAI